MASLRPFARSLTLLCLLPPLWPAAAPAAAPPPLAELLAAHGIQPVSPPAPAPDFTLPRVAGGEGALSASHGDWVVLTFFATWCAPCRSEMPTLERLHRDGADDGLAVVAVSVDRRIEPLAPFLAEHDLTLPVYWDQRGEVGKAYRATSIPVSYLIDPSGQIVGLARGARDWAASAPLFAALRQTLPASPEAPSRYAQLDALALPEVLEPPTAEWSLPAATPRPGRPFTLEVRLAWSGRLDDYLPQPPQITLPEGVQRQRVAATSSSSDRSHLVRYQVELVAAEPGVYALDPIELRYLPAAADGPVSARVAGPTLEVKAAGPGRGTPLLAALAAALAAGLALAGGWLFQRRRRGGAAAPAVAPEQRLREQLDRAKARRLAGEAAAGYELLVAAARQLETPDERRELEQRLESVRFGGTLPGGAELEAIERRLERALARRRPDPDDQRRRRLKLRRQRPQPHRPRKETTG